MKQVTFTLVAKEIKRILDSSNISNTGCILKRDTENLSKEQIHELFDDTCSFVDVRYKLRNLYDFLIMLDKLDNEND